MHELCKIGILKVQTVQRLDPGEVRKPPRPAEETEYPRCSGTVSIREECGARRLLYPQIYSPGKENLFTQRPCTECMDTRHAFFLCLKTFAKKA